MDSFLCNDDKFKETYDKIRELLRDYHIPIDYLRTVIKNHFTNKEQLIRTYKLTQDKEWKISFDLPTTHENRPLAQSVLLEIESISNEKYKLLDLAFMWQGKNKFKVTKILPEFIENYYNKLTEDNYDYFTSFTPYYAISQLLNDAGCCYSAGLDATINRALCYYGDYIKNGRVAYISADPYDFFTLSGENCTFSSCIRVDGEYANTILHYLNSPNVLVGYVKEHNKKNTDSSQRKIGRTMIYTNHDLIMTSRLYGSMFDNDTLMIRDYMQNIRGGRWIVKGSVNDHWINNESSAYIDYGCGTATVRAGVDEPDVITIEDGICLSCGDNINGQEHSMTCDCCSDDRTECPMCGRRFHYDEGYTIEDYEDSICERCFNNRCGQCSCCDNYYRDSSLTEITTRHGDELYCNDCRDDNTFVCYECDNIFHTDLSYFIDGYGYCEECKDTTFNLCECGEYVRQPETKCADCIHEEEERKERIEDENNNLGQAVAM